MALTSFRTATKSASIHPDYRVMTPEVEIVAGLSPRRRKLRQEPYEPLADPEFGPRKLFASFAGAVHRHDDSVITVIANPAGCVRSRRTAGLEIKGSVLGRLRAPAHRRIRLRQESPVFILTFACKLDLVHTDSRFAWRIAPQHNDGGPHGEESEEGKEGCEEGRQEKEEVAVQPTLLRLPTSSADRAAA